MAEERDRTTLEVLSIAIKSEVEAIKLYNRMKELAKNEDLKSKLQFLIEQEKKHEHILTEAYNKKFPETKLVLPGKSLVPTIEEKLSGEADLKELFDAALEAEKKAQEFYEDLASKTNDQNSKKMLHYLAGMEKSHFSILEAEYTQLLTTEEYNSDEFLRGDRLMNLGP